MSGTGSYLRIWYTTFWVQMETEVRIRITQVDTQVRTYWSE